MKTLKLTIKGRVRKVGYRGIVDERAHDLGVTGYVKNLEDGKTVEIVAQHSDEKILKEFVEKIKTTEYPIRVDKVETEKIEASPYDDFQVIEGPLDVENRESLEASVIYMRQMAGGMKKLGESQDKTIEKLEEFHKEDIQQSEKMLEKQDEMLEKQDETIKVLGSKLDRFSDSTSQRFDTMEQKYGKVSENLEAISKDLHELVEILKAFKPKA